MDVLQRCEVTARLIQPGAAGAPGAVQEFGVHWVPSARDALNGESGIQSGQVELKLWEEGTATLLLPNAAGPDGRLHRERFLYFTSLAYRPGDEWVEIWRSDAEDTAVGPARPLFVGTPVSDSRSLTQIELRLEDGQRPLKKARETAAGFWSHAPRDVWEHYTQVWRAVVAEDFAERQLTYSTSPQSADGVEWQRAETVVGSVRLRAQTPGVAYVASEMTVTADLPSSAWRAETEATRTSGGIGLSMEPLGGGFALIGLYLDGDKLFASGAAVQFTPLDLVTTIPKGRVTLAIEGRDRWLYLYAAGQLRGVLPMPAGGESYRPLVVTFDPPAEAHVHNLLLRRGEPFLLRGLDRGELTLPGDQPRGGLVGAYYADQDLATKYPTVSTRLRHLLAPTREPSARRQDATVDLRAAAEMPPGLGDQHSTRWTGSIWLDLAAADHRVRLRGLDNAGRVWVGKTRSGEQTVDSWTETVGTSTSPYLRASLGPVSGWYPVVVEYANVGGLGSITLEVARADRPDAWVAVNAGTYRWAVARNGPVALWGLDDDPADGWADSSGNYLVLTNSGATQTAAGAGPTPGSRAADFNGSSQFASRESAVVLNATAAITVETWVNPDGVSGGYRRWISKESQYVLRQVNAQIEGIIWVGATQYFMTSGSVLVAGEWQHVAMTWDDADDQWRLYRNGVQVATRSIPGPISTTNNTLYIGSTFATSEFFDGKLAEAAIYSRRLTATEIADHYAARDAQESGYTSPLGIFERRVQGESHYEMLQQLSAQYGYQATVEPMQLESGEFPGRLAPRARVGRDVDKRLTAADIAAPNVTDIQVNGSAEDVADSLIGEGAGIAADGAQLTVEEVNFAEAARHAFLMQETESLSDVTIEANARQRLTTLLGLRQAPWEEVTVKPLERRDYVDTFPLTGALARFAWDVGDGVMLDLPEVGIVDNSGRQLTTVTWPFVPQGLGAPEVGLRQRPRNFRALLRKIQRSIVATQRSYQGQLTTAQGTVGVRPTTASQPDAYSRIVLPDDRSTIVRAELVVTSKSDASANTIEVNGTARNTFTAVGRYDITAYATALPGENRLLARATGGTGVAEYQLELLVAI